MRTHARVCTRMSDLEPEHDYYKVGGYYESIGPIQIWDPRTRKTPKPTTLNLPVGTTFYAAKIFRRSKMVDIRVGPLSGLNRDSYLRFVARRPDDDRDLVYMDIGLPDLDFGIRKYLRHASPLKQLASIQNDCPI